MKQRQAEGIRMARLRRVKFGRPSVPDPENIDEVIALYKGKMITSSQACEMCDLTRGTFYRHLKKNSGGH